MKIRNLGLVAALSACAAVGFLPAARAAEPPQPAAPAISEAAATALLHMGNTLRAKQFSFTAQTIRVYDDADGQPLHIFHTMKVTVRRPDRLAVHVSGDDGTTNMFYDGRTASIEGVEKKKYATVKVPDNLQGMMEEVMGRLHVDFPLADFLTDAPNKAFLSGVTYGREVGNAMVDGVLCRHLFFSQTPGIELELWVEKNAAALPRRLIVTYRLLPGQPSFVAQLSDWDFKIHPADAEFAFQPPAGATQVDLIPVGVGSSTQRRGR